MIQAGTDWGEGLATTRQRWTQLERRLWTAVRRRDTVDVRDAKIDPVHIWGPHRTVRAEVIRELLLAGPAPIPGHLGGLRLIGARITGVLDLSPSTIAQPFEFLECWFDEPVDLALTRTQSIFIQDCRLPGLRAHGMHTEGGVYLDGLQCTAMLDLTGAHITGLLSLDRARLSDPDGVALIADGANFGNSVSCRQGFSAVGRVQLIAARVGGTFDLDTATVTNHSGDAVVADAATIEANLFAGDGFRAVGAVALRGASIGCDVILANGVFESADSFALQCNAIHVHGQFVAVDSIVSGGLSIVNARVDDQIALSGAVLSNPGGDAFNGDGLQAVGLFCHAGLRAEGEFRLYGARLSSRLSFDDAVLRNPGGLALILDTMAADGGIVFNRCHVEGETRMAGAQVHGDIELGDTTLVNNGNTFTAVGADITGNLSFHSGFASTGHIDLSGARVGGQLSLVGVTLHNPEQDVLAGSLLTVGGDIFAAEDLTVRGTIDLARARVGGTIGLTTENIVGTVNLGETRADGLQLVGRADGRISLIGMTVRLLHHEPEHWPDAGNFGIQNLTYTALLPLGVPVRWWLEWVRRGLADGYHPQPYAQLATTLRNDGNDRDARIVLLARQRHRRRGSPLRSKPWGWLQDIAVGYGYVSWRAACWLAVLWLTGWLYFRTQHPLPAQPGGSTTDYQPALYALDLLLPVLSIGQRNAVHFAGPAQLVAVLITVCSWILGIAVLAGLTRALTRN
jgi:hypothetical protein